MSFSEEIYNKSKIQAVSSYVDDIFETFMMCTPINDVCISIRDLNKKENFLHIMTSLRSDISMLLKLTDEKIKVAEQIRVEEVKQIDSVLNKLTHVTQPHDNDNNNTAEDWTMVNYKNKIVRPMSTKSEELLSKVHITDTYNLEAIKIANWNGVKDDGKLYYVSCAEHFAIKVAGILFHGNIGNIYTNDKKPQKIKNCRYGDTCMRTICNYYHDPLIYSNSTDKRNFIANNWLYTPITCDKRSRNFGSLENINVDMVNINNEEISRFYDQLMHDLLCAILLKRYKN